MKCRGGNSVSEILKNFLYYGDNLKVMKNYLKNETVDLIYLDPPFNSNRDYNVLFKDEKSRESTAQIKAFDDTWHWNEHTEEIFTDIVLNKNPKASSVLANLVEILGRNQITAYLVMMTIRLIELHRILKSTGSIYLHCDSRTSHYLKIILDAIFGVKNFRNEIIWHYRRWTGSSKCFLRMHDNIFFYTKTNNYTFNPQYTEYTIKSLKRKQYYHTRIKGAEVFETDISEKGVLDNDVWPIPVLNSQAKERLGYPTQKPVQLLKKIILASSNEGDTVLDPFCGCGTTIEAAELLSRHWVGIDITRIAITLIKYRLNKILGKVNYKVIGEPETYEDAVKLAEEDKDRYQFQLWSCGLVEAKPFKKKGPDGGIDGIISFMDEKKPRKIIISVKSGKVDVKDIRELASLLDKNNVIGLFITLQTPTKPMITTALSHGYFTSENGIPYPKIQIRTIEQLLNGEGFKKPLS